ncbi:hypothetical protein DEI93_03220 [Curtobacterium sp. MCBD17_035]|uniref:hypothetical protein n=1 Tax=Curtobacterium sp. MCBD17_035 TaxID=2175673 RepID=UPI0011B52FA7|nr:hypothetical protein [Curtobacterium sp. MCBD17_035]WIB68068.1 hypothetical protein DEI93_03220 [Curtobacterium sp. MCBD17_035]
MVADLIRDRTWIRLEPDVPTDRNVPPVYITLARTPSGRLACKGLIIGALTPGHELASGEITSRILRHVKLPELLAAVSKVQQWGDEASAAIDDFPEAPQRVRSQSLDPALFETVARAYKLALERWPNAPIKNLALAWHQSEPTLRRWIQRARERGLLGASIPGRAGEQLPNERN